MPEDAGIATLESPAETTTTVEETPVGTGTEDTSTESTSESTEGDGSEQTEPTQPADGKFLSESDKAILAEIKAKDPKLAARVRNALFASEAFKKALPGGLKEVQQLRQTIEEVGGPEGIQALRTEQQEWEALDQQFIAGDPRFIENIAEASPEAFMALAPAVFGKFQELNPEGFSSYISQMIVGDMQASGLPLALERLQDFIADNPKAMAAWQQIAGYVNRLADFAKKPIAAPKQNAQQPDARATELDQREANLTRTEWRGAADTDRINTFNSEFAKLTAGRKISDTQKEAVKELYVSRLQAALRKTQNFNQNIDRYFANRDKAGYLRYISSIYKQEIPKALKSAIDSVLPGKPGPVKPGAPQAKPVAETVGKPAAGFAWTPTQPKASEVDVTHQFNTPQNWSAGKAVLKDGRKVTWKR